VPPVYDPPAPPTPTQDKLILITHGWNTSFQFYADFWAPLRNVIAARVGSDWKVQSYNWTADSLTGDLPYGPDLALSNGLWHGLVLGKAIAEQNYVHVHLIGHSAGSAVIAAAAYRIKLLSPNTKVHTTFLDAFAGTFLLTGVGNYQTAYGGNSDWSDHYLSAERYFDVCGFGTGDFTQLRLSQCYNVDVSLADPEYSTQCLSDHAWPRCFYRATVDSMAVADCGLPDGGTMGFGFPLSYEQVGGNLQTWISSRNSMYPRNGWQALPGTLVTADERGGDDDDSVWEVRNDPPMNLPSLTSNVSAPEAVVITGGAFSATTTPAGAPEPAPAWANFQITTTQPVNFIKFDLAFTSNPTSAGLVTLYVNGIERGKVDEPFALPGINTYAMPTPGELAPGQHVFSFRLDPFSPSVSSIVVSNVSTGWAGFVPAPCEGDANDDGAVGFADVTAALTNWGFSYPDSTGPGDANHDGVVNFADITSVLTNWGLACP
jgi:pimeloyl-ACP methyl ester carboxylesterase